MTSAQSRLADDSPQASRRTAFGCIGAIVALVLLVVTLPLSWYLMETSRGQRELAAEVEQIRKRGAPLTSVELNTQYHAIPGDYDTGAAILAALAVAHKPVAAALAKSLPQVGDGPEPPDLAEAWALQADVEEYLATHQQFFTLIEKHAAAQTKIRYAANFTPGIYTKIEHVQQLRHGARVLSLQFHVDLRRWNIDGAIQRIDQTVYLAETLRDEPFLVAQLVRMALIGVALHNLEYLLENVNLTDAQLAQLQATFRQPDMQHGFGAAMQGELASGYTATTWSYQHLADGVPSQPVPDDEIIRLAKRGPNRPGDAALMLQFYRRLQEANDESLAAAAAEANVINDEIKELAGTHRKFFYIQTLLLFPAVQGATNAFLRTDARCQSADTALAALRYRQAQGTWPAQLTDLVPTYLPAVPTDPYNGKPLLFRTTADEFKVYAVGENKTDNGGTWTDREFIDVGFVAPWREGERK